MLDEFVPDVVLQQIMKQASVPESLFKGSSYTGTPKESSTLYDAWKQSLDAQQKEIVFKTQEYIGKTVYNTNSLKKIDMDLGSTDEYEDDAGEVALNDYYEGYSDYTIKPNGVVYAETTKINGIYTSAQLAVWQNSIATYCLEIEMLYDTLRKLITGIYKPCTNKELVFTADFSRPIVNNTHTMTVNLTAPIELYVKIDRSIKDERMSWSVDVGIMPNTPNTVINLVNTFKFNNNGFIKEKEPQENNKRKITI